MARWQLECEMVEQRWSYLFTSGLWSDCIFMVDSETNQEEIQAHKLVLAMASPVFEAMFYGWFSERYDPTVRIPDIQPEAFRALLQYIYTRNLNIGSFDIAWEVLYGAKKYMLQHLEKECIRYICSVLDPSNVLRAYKIACFFDAKTVMDECMKVISKNTDAFLYDDSFKDVELRTLITVFSLDYLNVDSELNLFHALARYVKQEQRRQEQISPPVEGEPPSKKLCNGLESSTSEEKVLPSVESNPADSKPPAKIYSEPTADKQNLKEEPTIRTALQKIRFLAMTAQEFADGPALSEFLTRDESFTLLINILRKDRPVPMPTGFTECRMWRRLPYHSYDRVRQCLKRGCYLHTINALKCGDPSKVQEAATAAAEFLSCPVSCCQKELKRAFDQGILDALVPALTEGDDMCKEYAAKTMHVLCTRGSPKQIRELAASAALEPYCRLLANGGYTCYLVLCGLTDLLKRVRRNTNSTDFYSNLREIGVPQLLLTKAQDDYKDEYRVKSNRKLANALLQKYFNDEQ